MPVRAIPRSRSAPSCPLTGPAAAHATIGHTIAAYFKKINAEGGLNGRKLNLIASDDSYNPATTLQQARRLVEDEQVLLIFAGLGTQTNAFATI
jgi:branched-chain amino acid transport system substrate-binding protein